MKNEKRTLVITREIKDKYHPYTRIPNHIIKDESLSINEKYIIYLLYSNKKSYKEQQCTLIERTKLSKSTIIRVLKSLEQKKLIKYVDRLIYVANPLNYMSGYTKVANKIIRSEELSSTQVHIMVVALSNRDDFKITVQGLAKQCGFSNRTQFGKHFSPLRDLGYFDVKKFYADGWGSNVKIYETPKVSKVVSCNEKKSVKSDTLVLVS